MKLSTQKYIEKLLSRFSLQDPKIKNTPMGSHFLLSNEQLPKIDEERKYMAKVSCTSIVGSLIYVMVCRRSDITHVVEVHNKYMSDPGKSIGKMSSGFLYT